MIGSFCTSRRHATFAAVVLSLWVARGDSAQVADISGTWSGTYVYGPECLNYRGDHTLQLAQANNTITGTVADRTSSPVANITAAGTVNGTFDGATLSLTYAYTTGQRAQLRATIVGDTLTGRATGICGSGADVRLTRTPSCPLLLDPTYASASYSGAADSFHVTASADCHWTATSDNPSWPVTVFNRLGQGSADVNYAVGPNATGLRRYHTIRVKADGAPESEAQILTIEQPSSGVPQLQLLFHNRGLFENVPVNTDSPAQDVEVANVGSVPVTIAGAVDCPTKRFRVQNISPAGFTLVPGATSRFPVVFTPQAVGPAECDIWFSPDPSATELLYGTGVPAANASLSLNQQTFAPTETMVLTASFPPLQFGEPVDTYVSVALPDGSFISVQAGGGTANGTVPFSRGAPPVAGASELLRFTFTGNEPKGTYTWYLGFARAGTMHFVAPVQQVTFTVR